MMSAVGYAQNQNIFARESDQYVSASDLDVTAANEFLYDCDGDDINDVMDPSECDGTPNPNPPVPIDDYVPFLALGAVTYIYYLSRKRAGRKA